MPISTHDKEAEIRYEDVGTNIDGDARSAEDGRFLLALRVKRSSIYQSPAEEKTEELPRQNLPVLRTYRSSSTVLLRDG